MGDLVRKRGRPVKIGGRRRRLELRMTDEEYDILLSLARITGKTYTDILMDGLRKLYDEAGEVDYDYYDDYFFEDESDDFD